MSKAAPMSNTRREAIYRRIGATLSPRQRRALRRAANKARKRAQQA